MATAPAPSRHGLHLAMLFGAALTFVACAGTDGANNDGGGSLDERAAPAASPAVTTSMCSAATASSATLGYELNDALPDLVLRDCDGEEVHLSRLCGAKALWMHVSHAWCPFSKKVAPAMEGIHDQYRSRGLVTVEVLLETGDRTPPTTADCRAWRDENGLLDVITLIDPLGATRALNDTTRTNLSVFVDAKGVIRGKTHYDATAELTKRIERTLDLP